jgi:cell shape-determining protein MreD
VEGAPMIRRITGIILGVVAFFVVFWLSGGFATPATPNWALAILVGLVVALIWPWIMGLIMVRRVRQRRQDEIDKEVQNQLAKQQNNPPPS